MDAGRWLQEGSGAFITSAAAEKSQAQFATRKIQIKYKANLFHGFYCLFHQRQGNEDFRLNKCVAGMMSRACALMKQRLNFINNTDHFCFSVILSTQIKLAVHVPALCSLPKHLHTNDVRRQQTFIRSSCQVPQGDLTSLILALIVIAQLCYSQEGLGTMQSITVLAALLLLRCNIFIYISQFKRS